MTAERIEKTKKMASPPRKRKLRPYMSAKRPAKRRPAGLKRGQYSTLLKRQVPPAVRQAIRRRHL